MTIKCLLLVLVVLVATTVIYRRRNRTLTQPDNRFTRAGYTLVETGVPCPRPGWEDGTIVLDKVDGMTRRWNHGNIYERENDMTAGPWANFEKTLETRNRKG